MVLQGSLTCGRW